MKSVVEVVGHSRSQFADGSQSLLPNERLPSHGPALARRAPDGDVGDEDGDMGAPAPLLMRWKLASRNSSRSTRRYLRVSTPCPPSKMSSASRATSARGHFEKWSAFSELAASMRRSDPLCD